MYFIYKTTKIEIEKDVYYNIYLKQKKCKNKINRFYIRRSDCRLRIYDSKNINVFTKKYKEAIK